MSREQRQALTITALEGAHRQIELHGWMPYGPSWAYESDSRDGKLTIIQALHEALGDERNIVIEGDARAALGRVCGRHVHEWEDLPLITEADVLRMLGRAIESLGGIAPEPIRRRGGWRISSGVAA